MSDQRFRPMATFSGIRRIPLLALTHNSLYPSVTVQATGAAIVVVRTHVFTFDEIEAIEARWLFGHDHIHAESGLAHVQRDFLWPARRGRCIARAQKRRRAACALRAGMARLKPLADARRFCDEAGNWRGQCSALNFGKSY